MKIHDKFTVREGASVMTWHGPVPYEKVKGKVGEYIGNSSTTGFPVLDFGALGPMRMTCDVRAEDLVPVLFKKVFEGVVEYDKEDGGQALIATIYDEDDENATMFVRLQSWEDENEAQDEEPKHLEAMRLSGKRVRITVEELP